METLSEREFLHAVANQLAIAQVAVEALWEAHPAPPAGTDAGPQRRRLAAAQRALGRIGDLLAERRLRMRARELPESGL